MRGKIVTPASTYPQTEERNSDLNSRDEPSRRQELGQFLTPKPVAGFMASLFEAAWRELNLLDAGAGVGALSAALVQRLCREERKLERISITAYELDPALIGPLQKLRGVIATNSPPSPSSLVISARKPV